MSESGGDWDQWEREQAAHATAAEVSSRVRVSGPSSSRHAPDEVAVETAVAGAAAAAQLERSRQLRPGWRWSPEQKRLRALVRAQRRVGVELQELQHVGARVLHARRLPDSAQPVDHIVITAGATFAIFDVVCSRDQPLRWTPDGHLALSGVGSLEHLEQAVAESAPLIARTAAAVLPEGWVVSVMPALAVVGPWPDAVHHTSGHLNVGSPAALRRWMGSPYYPAKLDPVDIAVLANVVARACPSAV